MGTIHDPLVPRGPNAAGLPWDEPAREPQRPPVRRHRRRIVAAAAIAIAMIAALGSAWALGTRDAPSTTVATAASFSTSAVAAKVDPSLVDVNSTLGYQHAAAAGTGIVATSSGAVLTNNHVVAGATAVSVTDIGNGRTYKAAVVGYDETADIAVLQLQDASGLTTAAIGDSSKVSIGEKVVALGNAGGKGGAPSVATGTVTSLGAVITASGASAGTSEQLTGLIRTNVDLRAGDSGGPLVNTAGQVIGIDTAASSVFQLRSGTPAAAESFAIPVNQAAAIARQIETGKASAAVHVGATAFLGVALLTSGSTPGTGGDGAAAAGAAVADVEAGSPASATGLAPGDVIESIDGQAVHSQSAVAAVLVRHHPGDKVSISWIGQSGQRHTATVVLAVGPVG